MRRRNSSEINAKNMTFGLLARFYSRTRIHIFSPTKVPEFVLESTYFSPLSLVYSAFIMVFLVVPDPRTRQNTKYNNLP